MTSCPSAFESPAATRTWSNAGFFVAWTGSTSTNSRCPPARSFRYQKRSLPAIQFGLTDETKHLSGDELAQAVGAVVVTAGALGARGREENHKEHHHKRT